MSKDERPSASKPPTQSGKTPRRHPAFGCMKGMITIMPGVDLTEPADPDWADLISNEPATDEKSKR